jgi:hypothetical protein
MDMKSKESKNSRSREFEKKLARYALAGTAIAGMPLFASSISNISVTATPQTGNVPLNFSFDGGSDIDFTLFESFNLSGGNYNVYVGVSGPSTTNFFGSSFKIPDTPIYINYPTAFTSSTAVAGAVGGSTVSGSNNKLFSMLVNNSGAVPYNGYKGNFQNNGNAYLGMTYVASGNIYLGWADILINASNGLGPATIQPPQGSLQSDAPSPGVTITIEDSGSEFLGTATPEPSSIALFALGAAGLAALRTRRKKLD